MVILVVQIVRLISPHMAAITNPSTRAMLRLGGSIRRSGVNVVQLSSTCAKATGVMRVD